MTTVCRRSYQKQTHPSPGIILYKRDMTIVFCSFFVVTVVAFVCTCFSTDAPRRLDDSELLKKSNLQQQSRLTKRSPRFSFGRPINQCCFKLKGRGRRSGDSRPMVREALRMKKKCYSCLVPRDSQMDSSGKPKEGITSVSLANASCRRGRFCRWGRGGVYFWAYLGYLQRVSSRGRLSLRSGSGWC